MWIFYVLIYSFIKGARDLMKKKALERSKPAEVLVLYTVAAFLLVVPQAPAALQADLSALPLVLLKAVVLFTAYLCAFHAIRSLPIGLYGIVDLSRMIFSILLGVFFLQEIMGPWQVVGLLLVAVGILLLKMPSKKASPREDTKAIYICLAFLQSFLNACSGILDKIITRTMSSGALQFWFMLFLALLYVLYAIIIRLQINWKTALRNYWIWIIAFIYIVADRLLFIANGMEDSQVVLMTLLKRSGCIVTILGGRLFFGEKRTAYKLLCAAIVLAGICLAILL